MSGDIPSLPQYAFMESFSIKKHKGYFTFTAEKIQIAKY
jgi:hypothetical protein